MMAFICITNAYVFVNRKKHFEIVMEDPYRLLLYQGEIDLLSSVSATREFAFLWRIGSALSNGAEMRDRLFCFSIPDNDHRVKQNQDHISILVPQFHKTIRRC